MSVTNEDAVDRALNASTLAEAVAAVGDEPNNPIVFKDDDGAWTVLRFAPFQQDKFDTWGEAYAHAYWSARIGNVLADVFAGGECA